MKKYKVTIKGSAQLNGPLCINRSFITDDARLAQSFNGSKRYEVIEGWVKANYPGAKIPSIRGFGANIQAVEDDEESKKSSSWWKLW